MPFIGFVCEADGSRVGPYECLACARAGAKPKVEGLARWPGEMCPMTAPVVEGILRGIRPADFGLTVTSLLGCPRKARLMQSNDYWLKPGEAWWAYRGQLMHGVSAEYAAGDEHAIAETRFAVMDGVSGQPDLVLVDRRHLVDYKTTRSVPGPWRTWTCPAAGGAVIRESQFPWRGRWIDCPHCEKRHEARAVETLGPPRAYLRHVQQVSLYRLLLWENGVEVDTAEIVYQSMAEQVRVEVELLGLEEARVLLDERTALHRHPALPDILRDPEDLWECDWCPVREACERLHGGPVGKAMLAGEAEAEAA